MMNPQTTGNFQYPTKTRTRHILKLISKFTRSAFERLNIWHFTNPVRSKIIKGNCRYCSILIAAERIITIWRLLFTFSRNPPTMVVLGRTYDQVQNSYIYTMSKLLNWLTTADWQTLNQYFLSIIQLKVL
jgi:hypothetical protein